MGLTEEDLAENPKPKSQKKTKSLGFGAFDLLDDDEDQTGSEPEVKPEVISPNTASKKKKKRKKKRNNQTENKPERTAQSQDL